MKILVIGGTSFVGRHIVEALLEKEHEVVLFNRGKSNPHLFPQLQKILGDRRKDAEKLAAEKWDAVIDSSAYTPADLKPVLKNLKTNHYIFISTISVYDDFKNGPVRESGSLFNTEVTEDEVTGSTYGPLKVMCENYIEKNLSDKALILRPGIVVGPYDPTDRFTYWVMKLNGKGPVLVPGSKERKIQWVDARDLAEFTVLQMENKTTGVYNVAADAVSMEELVQTLNGGEADCVWADDHFLLEQGLKAFELPFWIPFSTEFPEGFLLVDNEKAKSAGLGMRSVKQSAQDTLEWAQKEGLSRLKTGISENRERELLNKIMK